jgi:hypothetical protein
MFRRTPASLLVGPYARFLMDSKGKHVGMTFIQRDKTLAAEFN